MPRISERELGSYPLVKDSRDVMNLDHLNEENAPSQAQWNSAQAGWPTLQASSPGSNTGCPSAPSSVLATLLTLFPGAVRVSEHPAKGWLQVSTTTRKKQPKPNNKRNPMTHPQMSWRDEQTLSLARHMDGQQALENCSLTFMIKEIQIEVMLRYCFRTHIIASGDAIVGEDLMRKAPSSTAGGNIILLSHYGNLPKVGNGALHSKAPMHSYAHHHTTFPQEPRYGNHPNAQLQKNESRNCGLYTQWNTLPL